MVFIINLVKKSRNKLLVLLFFFICGCQTDAEWFKNGPTPVETIKIHSYDDELQDEQLKYVDTGFWLTDYINLPDYILN